MKPVERWSLVAAGCGTVNLACVRALAQAPIAEALDGASLIDPAVIRELNALTCPEYAGHRDQYKVERLAELVRAWRGELPITLSAQDVEDVDWKGLLEVQVEGRAAARLIVVLIGLDNWQSRLNVIEDLRHTGSAEVLPIQVSVERDQAQVAVFGNRWADACPACPMAFVPPSETCTLFSPEGELVRGDLQREARAAAELVTRIVTDQLAANGTASSWVATKTNLHAERPGSRRFNLYTRTRIHMDNCNGPHSAATPIRWDRTG